MIDLEAAHLQVFEPITSRHGAVGGAPWGALAQHAVGLAEAAQRGVGRQHGLAIPRPNQRGTQIVVVQLDSPARVLAVLGDKRGLGLRRQAGEAPGVRAQPIGERGNRIARAPGRVVPALQSRHTESHVQAAEGVAPGLGGQCAQRTEQLALGRWRGQQRADDGETQTRLAVAFGDVVTLAQVGSQQRRHRSCGARGIEGYRASRAVTIAILCGCRVSLTLLDRRAQRLQPARHEPSMG